MALEVKELLDDLESDDFKIFKFHLYEADGKQGFSRIPRNLLENADRLDTVKRMEDHYGAKICAVTEKVLSLMHMNGLLQKLQQRRPEPLDDSSVGRCQDDLRRRLRNTSVTTVCSRPLREIYTELHILTQDSGTVNTEHEIMGAERAQSAHNVPTVTCNDIFKASSDGHAPLRVLTKGVTGIGKTVVTQKFILDWAEGRDNQDLRFVFPIPFQELNLVEPERAFSLEELIHYFYPEVSAVGADAWKRDDVAFVFDGLDESSTGLDFEDTRIVTDVSERRTPEELLVNLIRGKLLPNARVWVTSRPAAANQIPPKHFHMITEIQGFTDTQKDEYLRKLLKDEEKDISEQIICHIKEIRTLYIMCHIPMFVWITAWVLKNIFKEKKVKHLPKTLTELYISFLMNLTQRKHARRLIDSEHWSKDNKKMLMALARLAFQQLNKGSSIFSVKDLRDCGINIRAAVAQFGLLTQVFNEVFNEEVYSFIHLSVQEFLAALHVHFSLVHQGINVMMGKNTLSRLKSLTLLTKSTSDKLTNLHQYAVDKALNSPQGHWDMFLRFLMGLSLPSNQKRLQDLIKETRYNHKTIVSYIHRKLDRDLPLEQSMNLCHCLTELNDCTLETRIQESAQSGPLSAQKLTPSMWSALTFLLLSRQPLTEFDLKKYCASETALMRLLPVVHASRLARLNLCNLTERVCSELGRLLSSDSCQLLHLDLSDNNLSDSGINSLLSALERPNHSLQVLRLRGCLVTAEGCSSLALAVETNLPSLREVDLSYNHPGEGLRLLKALQEDPNCRLQRVRAEPHGEEWLRLGLHKYMCELTWDTASPPKHLDLSEDQTTLTATDALSEKSKARCIPELSGRCYWEAECHGDVKIKVKATAAKSAKVHKQKSWSIKYKNNSITKKKNTRKIGSMLRYPELKKVGVFLDVSRDEAGDQRNDRHCDKAAKLRGFLHFYLMDTDSGLTPAYTQTVSTSGHLSAAFVFLSPGTIVRLCSPDDRPSPQEHLKSREYVPATYAKLKFLYQF